MPLSATPDHHPRSLFQEISDRQTRIMQSVTTLCLRYPQFFQTLFAQVATDLQTNPPTDHWHRSRQLNQVFRHASLYQPTILKLAPQLSILATPQHPQRSVAQQWVTTVLPRLALSREFILTRILQPLTNSLAETSPDPALQHIQQEWRHIELAANQILEQHTNLLKGLVRKFARYFSPADYDDLLQSGRLAIWRAIDRFVPDRNIDFPQFASICVINTLDMELRRHHWHGPTRHVLRHLQRLTQSRWTTPSWSDLATATALPEPVISTEYTKIHWLLTDPLPTLEPDSATPDLPETPDQTPFHHLLHDSRRRLLQQIIDQRLTPKQKLVITLRHGLPTAAQLARTNFGDRIDTLPPRADGTYSLKDISQLLGQSAEYIRQVHDKALAILTKRARWIENL